MIKEIIYIIIFIMLLIIFMAGFADGLQILTIPDKLGDDSDLSNALYFISGAATVALALIAFSNLASLNNINKNKHLIQIDQRWGDQQIIRARQIIHVIYREVCDFKNYETDSSIKLSEVTEIVSKIIVLLSLEKDRKIRPLFTYLLNYLDFMETVSYIYKDKETSEKGELQALVGETMQFNFDCYLLYIQYRNTKHLNSKYYSNFFDYMNKSSRLRLSTSKEIFIKNLKDDKDLIKIYRKITKALKDTFKSSL